MVLFPEWHLLLPQEPRLPGLLAAGSGRVEEGFPGALTVHCASPVLGVNSLAGDTAQPGRRAQSHILDVPRFPSPEAPGKSYNCTRERTAYSCETVPLKGQGHASSKGVQIHRAGTAAVPSPHHALGTSKPQPTLRCHPGASWPPFAAGSGPQDPSQPHGQSCCVWKCGGPMPLPSCRPYHCHSPTQASQPANLPTRSGRLG